jgi:opacity protein-like surface antigen
MVKHVITKSIPLTILAIILQFGLTNSVIAEQSRYEINYLLIDTNIQGAAYEPNALQYKHIIPYNSFIDLEGIVALGINEKKVTRKIGVGGIYTQKLTFSNMLGVMVKLYSALEPKVHGYIHFGLARIDYDISTPSWVGGPDGSQSDTGFAYGFGLSFAILKKGAFILEFNELPEVSAGNSTIDTSVLSIGYQMPFD